MRLLAVALLAAGLLAQPAAAAPIGRSVQGRPLVAIVRGDPAAKRRLRVVGCIHGNECAGIAAASALARLAPPPGVAVWIVPDLNPDGHARGTRGNANGVDLNRNFPWDWRRLGGIFDSGPRALSEPESRAAQGLILRVRPTVSIWFHQHLGLVDESGGSVAVERRFARLAGLPLQRLAREPGSVSGWENHVLPGATAFVVELPAGALSAVQALRYARAALEVAR